MPIRIYMPRQARIVIPNIPHHITQRGNRRQNIFFSSYDRSFFLELLKHYSEKFSIDVIAYCLMTNHIHVVAVPGSSDSFHLAFKSIFRRYGSFKNTVAGWTGHFWQERFFSSPLDEGHFWTALRYVELNPVRAKMVAQAADYRWSSARAHCNAECDMLLARDSVWHRKLDRVSDWREFLSAATDHEINDARERFCRSLPFGDESFVANLEQVTGRVLRVRPKGRPRKQPSETVAGC